MKQCAKCGIKKPFDAFSKLAKGCKHGLHARCKPCRSQDNAAWNFKNSVKVADNMKKWRHRNATHVKTYSKEWHEKNRDKNIEKSRQYRKNNPVYFTVKQNERRSFQLQATPSWLSAIELAQIAEFYEIAKCKTVQTGIIYHVDHIVPLKGKDVRGLHVPWNLQILTAEENFSKRNKLLENL